MELIFLGLLGIISGISSGVFGIGGGVIIVPALMLFGFDIPFAIGISIIQMIFASFFGSYLNYKNHKIDLKNGIALGIGGIIGSSFSGIILSFVSSKTLHFAFLCFTLVSFFKFFFSQKKTYEAKHLSIPKQYALLVLFGFIVGIFSSSLGVGGGLLLAPLLGIFLGLNSKSVIPLALFFICFSSVSGAMSLYIAGFVHLKEGIFVGAFSMLGVYLGLQMIQKISEKTHKIALCCVYILSITATLFKIF